MDAVEGARPMAADIRSRLAAACLALPSVGVILDILYQCGPPIGRLADGVAAYMADPIQASLVIGMLIGLAPALPAYRRAARMRPGLGRTLPSIIAGIIAFAGTTEAAMPVFAWGLPLLPVPADSPVVPVVVGLAFAVTTGLLTAIGAFVAGVVRAEVRARTAALDLR